MALRRRELVKLLAASAAGSALAPKAVFARPSEPIARDVAILGGGSAGTYAALRLRDLGHSVVVLERSQRLGGHAETYYDPISGAPIDIGVVIFPDDPLVRSYFGRFGVELVSGSGSSGTPAQRFVDFRTGAPVMAYRPSQEELGAAFGAYLQLLTTRFAFLAQNGYRLPGSGPELDDLLLPFGQFAGKYGLNAILPTFFLFEQGFGPLLEATTLYVLKNMSAQVVSAALSGGFLAVPSGTSSLYQAATDELGEDVLFGTRVNQVERASGARSGGAPIRLRVQTDDGPRQIRAKKLLVTAPPLPSNLRVLRLDSTESAIFSRFVANNYWTAVAEIEGALGSTSLVNAAPDTPFNLPPLPGIYSVGPSIVPGLVEIKYGSTRELGDERVRSSIARDIARVDLPEIGPLSLGGYAIFKNHSPYMLHVSPGEIRGGFYDDLEALQGHNGTFYAGAAFQTHSSAAIWAYLEELVPRLFS